MPIYEYRCQSCAKELEVLVRGGNEPEHCPDCQGALARKISRAGVIFKGSGFYVTDSRSSSSGGDKKSSSSSIKNDGAGSDSPSGGETKSSDGKSSDTNSGDTKSSNSKASEGKSGGESGGSSKQTETTKKSSD